MTVLFHFSDSFDDSHMLMQHDLDNLNLWCRENLLQVNVKKTKSMYINHKTHLKPKTASLQKLTFNSDYIDFVDEYKYLGIWIDSQLSFAKHIKNIISNVSFIIPNWYSFKSY